MIRRLPLVLAFVVLAACAYESSGTTTTTVPLDDDRAAPTSPADLVVEDQKSEGSSLVVASVSLPAAGWVVVRVDEGGSPGEVIGISTLLQTGLIADVAVPFLLPLEGTTTVHLAVHIDVDHDGSFLYEPPDGFVDEIATRSNGEPAVAVATISLLPPLQPGDAFLDPQVTDGTSVVVAGGLLPAPGFLVLHRADDTEPGEVLGVSQLLPAGPVSEFVLIPTEPLRVSEPLMVVAWVDRDENGTFSPGEDGDAMAVRDDGILAAGAAAVTVLVREPGELEVNDQETDGAAFVVARLVMPSAGFIEILGDASNAPGPRLGSVAVGVGTRQGVSVDLPSGVATGATLWLRLWIDFDQDGALSDGDLVVLDVPDGDPIEGSFVVTIVP